MKARRKRITSEGKTMLFIAVPFIVYITAFAYVPLFGWLYAFVDFDIAHGVNPFAHTFAGFNNFVKIVAERNEVIRVLKNTLALSFLGLACAPLAPLLAILFMELKSNKLKRITQTVTTFPNFISWIIVYGIAFSFFSNHGVFAVFTEWLGFPKQTISVIANENVVWRFQTLLGVCKSIGWGAIIYVAAISGIDESLYEAAYIDGANRVKCIRHITIPGISETFLVLLLLAISNILATNFDQQLIFNNSMVTNRLMGIDLYVYRTGITRFQYSYTIAVGIAKSMIGLGLLFGSNILAKRIRGETMV
jgi:ABC-type polysaccharide transport system permease subunit